jgi:D-3-phosphoglycerate dehydrogenase
MGGIGKASNYSLPAIYLSHLSQQVAKRARSFGMNIHYHNRHPLPPSEEEGALSVSFDDLISQSDVISLNLALTYDTEHIIGANEFEKMKKGVVIVNTARGDLIDEEELFKALESGKVYSVGLDVFENEPHVDPRFLGNEKIAISPHIGAATVETMVSQ